MKIAGILLLAILAFGCAKHKDPGPSFSSVEGKWTYTTPDAKITVLFDLVKITSDSLDIQHQSIKVGDVTGNAAYEITSSSLTSITRIRINANDSHLTYPYNILFKNGQVSNDYKTITFSSAVYTWPYPSEVDLTNVVVNRQ